MNLNQVAAEFSLDLIDPVAVENALVVVLEGGGFSSRQHKLSIRRYLDRILRLDRCFLFCGEP